MPFEFAFSKAESIYNAPKNFHSSITNGSILQNESKKHHLLGAHITGLQSCHQKPKLMTLFNKFWHQVQFGVFNVSQNFMLTL